MIKLLDNKKTSKIALYFLMIWVFSIIVIFGALGDEGYIIPIYALSRPISEFDASGGALNSDTIRTGGVIQLTPVSVAVKAVESKIREVAEKEDFQWPDYLVRLGKCESGLNPKAKGDGRYNSRGVFQISKFYHPEVSDKQAYDVEWATKWTMKKINAGQQKLWSCDQITRLK